jgi:hypothetical protein
MEGYVTFFSEKSNVLAGWVYAYSWRKEMIRNIALDLESS